MKNEACWFCGYKTNSQDIVLYENDLCYLRLDMCPVAPGHMEAVPKKHILLASDLDNKTWIAILDCIKRAKEIAETRDLASDYKKALENLPRPDFEKFIRNVIESPFLGKKPDAFTIGINDGEAAGRSVHHCHLHIIPRYWGDVKEPRGGVRAIFGDGSY